MPQDSSAYWKGSASTFCKKINWPRTHEYIIQITRRSAIGIWGILVNVRFISLAIFTPIHEHPRSALFTQFSVAVYRLMFSHICGQIIFTMLVRQFCQYCEMSIQSNHFPTNLQPTLITFSQQYGNCDVETINRRGRVESLRDLEPSLPGSIFCRSSWSALVQGTLPSIVLNCLTRDQE